MTNKIILEKPRPTRADFWLNNHPNFAPPLYWLKSLPFVANPRGRLTHRVRYAKTNRRRNGSRSHDTVSYWCGNGCHSPPLEAFYAVPPETRLLCHICEAKAVAAGEKTADELAGRHVHVGKLKAHRTCCRDQKN